MGMAGVEAELSTDVPQGATVLTTFKRWFGCAVDVVVLPVGKRWFSEVSGDYTMVFNPRDSIFGTCLTPSRLHFGTLATQFFWHCWDPRDSIGLVYCG